MKIHSVISENDKEIVIQELGYYNSGGAGLTQSEYVINLGQFGTALVRKLSSEQLCILNVNFDLRRDVTDVFRIDDEHILMSFFFKGNSNVRNLLDNENLRLDTGILRMSYQPFMDTEIKMTPEEPVNYLAIIISRPYFLALLEKESWSSYDELFTNVIESRYISLDKTSFVIANPMRTLLSQLFDRSVSGPDAYCRELFLDIKLRELLLLLHIDHHADRRPVPKNLTRKTYTALENAKGILQANFKSPITIKKLSRMVVLNEQTLKTGFRLLYHTTINNYILEARMHEAARLMLHTDLSIGQIAQELGYKSISHFIMVFKKYYGITPKQAILNREILIRYAAR